MNELKLFSGRIRVYEGSIEFIHPISKKKKQHLDDINILFKDIHHVELFKPLWPFAKGYIRFSLDGSHHAKKNKRAADQESFSMLCHSKREYKKLEKVKQIVENKIELSETDRLSPIKEEQVEKLIDKLQKAREKRKTGRQKRLISKLESIGIEVDLQEEGVRWKLREETDGSIRFY